MAKGKGKGPTARLMGIEEHTLPNGFRAVLAPDPAKPTFTVNLTVLVGSIHEGAGEAGMAHVFEHLLFRSLKGFPNVEKTLNGMGAAPNGTTWFDRTNFFTTLASSDDNLKTMIRLEAARLGGALLHPGDLAKERLIVENEFEMRNTDPQSLMFRGMLGCMFDFHAYAREPIGTLEEFRSLGMANIRAFYGRHYTPDNAVLFLTGRFDPGRALALIGRHFGGLRRGRPRPAYATREPASRGERRYTVRGAGDAFHIAAGYRVPGAAGPEAAAADVLATALNHAGMGPLHDALVAKGLATRTGVMTLDLRMPCPWVVTAAVPPDKDPEAAEAALLGVAEKGAQALAPADIGRAKAVIERYREDMFNSPEELADKLSQFEAGGSWKLLFVRCEQIKAATPEDVRAFAAKYLRRENRVVGRFEPDPSPVTVLSDPEPPIGSYAELLAKIPPTAKSAKAFDYSPAALAAASTWLDVGSARICLIRKEVKGDDVFVSMRIPFAGRAAVAPLRSAGSALAEIMTRRTESLGKEELEARFAEWGSYIGLASLPEGAGVGIKAKRNRLGAALPVMWEMLRKPCVREAEVHDHVTRKTGDLRSLHDKPQLLMGIEANRMVFPEGDPRRIPAPERQLEEVGKLTPDSILGFHREFFGGDRLLGCVVGDVPPEEIRALFSPLTGDGWKAAKAPVEEPNGAVDGVTAAEVMVRTPGKPAAFNVLVQPLRISGRSPDNVPMAVASWILWEDPLASRIPKRVRGEEALSYAVQGHYVAGLDGDFGEILLYVVTAPANAEKAVLLVREELGRALKEGFGAEEVETAKKSFMSRMISQRSDDNVVAAMTVELARNGLDYGHWTEIDRQLAAVTPEDVNAALRRHVDPPKMGLIRIGDFK